MPDHSAILVLFIISIINHLIIFVSEVRVNALISFSMSWLQHFLLLLLLVKLFSVSTAESNNVDFRRGYLLMLLILLLVPEFLNLLCVVNMWTSSSLLVNWAFNSVACWSVGSIREKFQGWHWRLLSWLSLRLWDLILRHLLLVLAVLILLRITYWLMWSHVRISLVYYVWRSIWIRD